MNVILASVVRIIFHIYVLLFLPTKTNCLMNLKNQFSSDREGCSITEEKPI